MNNRAVLGLTVFVIVLFNMSTIDAQLPKFKFPKITESKSQPATPDTAKPTTPPANQQGPQTSSATTGTEPVVNRPSIQINLRTHLQYYRNGVADQDWWSWTPRIAYRVNGPISAGSQLSVEFVLPSGKLWIKLDCPTNETKENYWWTTECGMNSNDVRDQDATIETGFTGFKIVLKNELEGTTKTLFTGKFKVDKFVVNPANHPKFNNNFAYYVNYDWNLPIGYLTSYDWTDFRPSYPPSPTQGRLEFITWFKGDPKLIEYGKYIAYLYYNGKLVADSTAEPDTYSITSCQVTNAAYYESPNTYCRRVFGLKAWVWNKDPQNSPANYFNMYANPGEYEIKILENGKLARSAKFTMGKEYQLVDNGIAKQNGLGTARIVVPVQIIGDQDGVWDRNAWKTEAFYGNPMSGFVVP